MTSRLRVLFGIATVAAFLPAQETADVVFRSEVNLVRVDVQVVDRDNRAITGLAAEDFVLREEGRKREIRNFATEDMPVDFLLLLDVSGSMRPQVQRLASAAHSALRVLGRDDRVAIMVFDRSTRVRMTFRNGEGNVERELENLLRQEHFNGGTDITRALVDAADYMRRQARKEARRAIVILTDDETEFGRDDLGVGRALVRADAVLSALIAPNAMLGRQGYPGGGYPPQRRGGIGFPGGGWPGGGGGGWPGGGGTGYPGGTTYPGGGGSRTRSAGTSEIARESGGDSLPVDDATALEMTLARIRQRYALYFLVPPGATAGQQRTIDIELAPAARRRYSDAEVRYRRVYISPTAGDVLPPGQAEETPVVSERSVSRESGATGTSESRTARRRAAQQERNGGTYSGPIGPAPVEETAPAATSSTSRPPDPAPAARTGGWRRVNEPAPAVEPAAPPKPDDPDRPVLKRSPKPFLAR